MDVKHSRALEVAGNVMGYIPGVSTIAGGIKAIVYFHRMKKSDAASKKEQEAMAGTTNKIEQLKLFRGQEYPINTLNPNNAESHLYKEIIKWSLLQMVPFINMGVAFAESSELKSLKIVRNLKENPGQALDITAQLLGLPKISSEPPEKRDYLGRIMSALENLKIDKVPHFGENIAFLSKEVKQKLYHDCANAYDANSGLSSSELLKEKIQSMMKEYREKDYGPRPADITLNAEGTNQREVTRNIVQQSFYDKTPEYAESFINSLQNAINELDKP